MTGASPSSALDGSAPAGADSSASAGSPEAASSAPASASSGSNGPGRVDFDHAITYVTKVKKRFAQAPATYRSFLEILHTYQKDKRSIAHVLDRVSVLFRYHTDLLQDFVYFLPDAIQETARERLERDAEAARARDRNNAAGGEPEAGEAGGEDVASQLEASDSDCEDEEIEPGGGSAAAAPAPAPASSVGDSQAAGHGDASSAAADAAASGPSHDDEAESGSDSEVGTSSR